MNNSGSADVAALRKFKGGLRDFCNKPIAKEFIACFLGMKNE